MGRREAYTGFWWENLRERVHLGDPGLDGSMLLSWIFRKWDVGVWTWIELAQDRGTCECGNEPSGSIKYREFPD
jgi:hypothetical protein